MIKKLSRGGFYFEIIKDLPLATEV